MLTFKQYILEESLSDLFTKWIEKNRHAFMNELKQDARAMQILDDAAHGYALTDANKRFVKIKIIDILKSLASLTFFSLPGSFFVFPVLVKAFPKMLPSSFRKEKDRITFHNQDAQFNKPA